MSIPIFVCWKWRAPPGYRSQFNHNHVNTLARMIRRHYDKPHEIVCITDNDYLIDKSIRIVPLWKDYSDLPNPYGQLMPSCYRRLKMFSEEARNIIGERFLSIDLDCVITGDLTPIVERSEDIVLWGDTHKTTHFNGGLILMTAGARKQVWDEFDPVESPKKSKEAKQFGSDQGWISYCLGPNEAKYSTEDGVYSFRCHLAGNGGRLPDNARIVLFHGQIDPDHRRAQIYQWVRQNYR